MLWLPFSPFILAKVTCIYCICSSSRKVHFQHAPPELREWAHVPDLINIKHNRKSYKILSGKIFFFEMREKPIKNKSAWFLLYLDKPLVDCYILLKAFLTNILNIYVKQCFLYITKEASTELWSEIFNNNHNKTKLYLEWDESYNYKSFLVVGGFQTSAEGGDTQW